MCKKIIISLFLLMLVGSSAFAATYTVTTTVEAGAGSLRQAILDANTNSGRDTIEFNIPTSEAVTEGGATFWRINITSEALILTEEAFVYGTSQTSWGGDLNPDGPEIELKRYWQWYLCFADSGRWQGDRQRPYCYLRLMCCDLFSNGILN